MAKMASLPVAERGRLVGSAATARSVVRWLPGPAVTRTMPGVMCTPADRARAR
jgi:hypothetical protein